MSDFNAQTIAEFRANHGKVGGPFEGAPLLLLHHIGRRSGERHIVPLMYLPDPEDAATVYIFASRAGAPTHPDWYYNVLDAGNASIEVGDENVAVSVREVPEPDRTTIYDRQKELYPGFREYEEKTAGIRTIPVLALTRQT
ncbi:nitroreductase family deazaflavin-dependent oxidoreductase [Nocardioides sp. Kera G14]|uniref:nitroreductase family deazaflavin-dependent oxidoreductase n=1 Tax=Nocardioides sp. Kera G14 TaxID=2884264 RepID=UPI001D0FD651|nr:nitroreductase family deazaflavin-dependent oxidoreductase [Nocardioides sp. Kera G14]UDY23535.1 nitroreductase family deazaflavin-dependent oxidoreductase [Nocardioides sp. Kera G14]